MRKKRRKKRAIILKFILIFIISGILLYFLLFMIKGKSNSEIAKIKNYDYVLEKRDTKLMEDNFYQLKDVLESKQIDYEKYAEYLSKLFIIDLYTIKNKDNRYDIGSVEYIYPDHRDNFVLKVADTLYRYVEEKSKRKQKLPEVASIDLKDIETTTYEYADNKYDAYEVSLSWDYVKDLEYDTSGVVTLIKIDTTLYVAEYNPEVMR